MTHVTTERQTSRRAVTWSASTKSEPVAIGGTAGWLLDLPAGFAGSQVTFEIEVADGVYRAAGISAVSVTADQVTPLPSTLLGAGKIKIVSDQTETLEAQLLVST